MGIKRLWCLETDSEFFGKELEAKRNKNLSIKVHETGLLDLLTESGRPRTSRSSVVQPGAVADWWYSWPMASTLASLCLSQRWTFWTYVMTVNLFSLYLINFMFRTMLDAAGVVLRVHYRSMKCDVLFSQGSARTIFRRGGHFSHMSKKISSSLQQCKNYKNRSRFPKVMITNVLPPFFMVHSVCRCKERVNGERARWVKLMGST